jgi:hypothetical protein
MGNPATVELAFRLLRTRPGRAAASRLLFGDGSFPDTVGHVVARRMRQET